MAVFSQSQESTRHGGGGSGCAGGGGCVHLKMLHHTPLWLQLHFSFSFSPPLSSFSFVSYLLASQTFFISWKDTLAHIQCNHLLGFYFSPHRPGKMTFLFMINKTIPNAKKNYFMLNLSLIPTVPAWLEEFVSQFQAKLQFLSVLWPR